MIEFTVPGLPVAQPRQRHRVVQGPRPFVQNYLPKNDPVQAYKATVRLMASQAMAGIAPMDGALVMDVTFIFPRPKRIKGKGREPHQCRPDADNCVKAVKDSLKGVVWNDDCQVAILGVQKMYAAEGEPSSTHVQVRKLAIAKDHP